MPMPVSFQSVVPSVKTRTNLDQFEHRSLPSPSRSLPCPHETLYRSRFTSSLLSTLRPGTKFSGYQRSGASSYPVSVDLKCVDVGRSTFCGYLSIQDLSPEFPSITTFFEAEIIGNHYNFLTRKWGASAKVDEQHWSRFTGFEPHSKSFTQDNYGYDPMNSDYIFMRWKEQFLVPRHRINHIDGISFSGFYYMCYQVSTGKLTGLYYHPKAFEWFQGIVLHHEPTRQFPEFEFR